MGLPETREHLANRGAKLADGLRRRCARPELRSYRLPVDAVHRRVEVRVADLGPDRVERLEAEGNLGRGDREPREHEQNGGERAAHHLTSVLISGGSVNTDRSTLSYSMSVKVSTC